MQTNKKDEEKSSDQQAEAPNEAIQYDGTESYRLLVESVSEYAILMLDPESHIVTWNIGAQRLFGYREEEALGQPGAIIFTEEDRATGEPAKEITTALREGKVEDDRWHRRQDGSRFWGTGMLMALYAPNGNLRGFAKLLRDNTERKAAEDALRESEARFRNMADHAPVMIWMTDADAMCNYLSKSWSEFTGQTPETGLGVGWLQTIHPDDLTYIKETVRTAYAQRVSFRLEYRLRRRDAVYGWVIDSAAPRFSPEGNFLGYIGSIIDITDRKLAEEALQQLNETLEARVEERTAQVRALASTLTLAEQEERRRISQILHDELQQLLYAIQMRVISIAETAKPAKPDTLTAEVQEVYNWLNDAIRTTRQLTVDLSPPILKNEGLTGALYWLAANLQEMYGLTINLHADHPFLIVDEAMRVLLFQIVRELLFNVIKHAGTNQATVELREGEDGRLIIGVRDAGRGFDRVVAEAQYDGGFGLFSVRERLALFGGRITINSAPGQGTHVVIYTPVFYVPQSLS